LASLGILTKFLFRVLNLVPSKFLLRIGYSWIGRNFVVLIKNSKLNQNRWEEIGYGVKMYVDLVDPHTWQLSLGKDKEKAIKEIFLDNIKEGSIVMDVGAHLGEYSLLASKKIGPSGTVFVIEPFQGAVRNIEKNFSLNGFKNYKLFPVALGHKLETKVIYESEIRGGAYLDPILNNKQLSRQKKTKIETIDNIISSNKIPKIDMLKIDVDGFEYEVLLGCKESFQTKIIKKILCEIHPYHLRKKGLNPEIIYSLLKKNNFSLKHLGETRLKTNEILAILN